MKLKHYDKELPFELIEYDDCTVKCLVFDDETEEEFEELGEDEQDRDEEWYLDENGYRLESEALFAASPWSLETPDGEVKLLQRFCKNGVTHFDTLNGYGGETFRCLHSRSPS
jgi:hypothetical protein